MPPSERVKNSSTVGPMPSSASEREEGETQSHEFVVGAARRTRRADGLRAANSGKEVVFFITRRQARGAADDGHRGFCKWRVEMWRERWRDGLG